MMLDRKRALWFILFPFMMILFAGLGYWVGVHNSDMVTANNKDPSEQSNATKILYWVAPMDPNYRRDKPGKSPMGMDLVPVYAGDKKSKEGGVIISSSVAHNLGIRTEIVKRQRLSRVIKTIGVIEPDENNISHIHTYTQGWIKKLYVKTLGEYVNKGQLLFEFYSLPLMEAQEDYLVALRTNSHSLSKSGANKLLALGVSHEQIAEITKNRQAVQRIRFYSPQKGIVAKNPAKEGMFIKPENNVMTIEDLSSVWLIAHVFEKQASWIKLGAKVEARLDQSVNETLHGKIDYIYPRLDQNTRTLRVRIIFSNEARILKPNMHANVTIYLPLTHPVLAIPHDAIIYSEAGPKVIAITSDGNYKPIPITIGIESGGLTEVRAGLTEGSKIVTSAQFLIDSEASKSAGLKRLAPESNAEAEATQHDHHQH